MLPSNGNHSNTSIHLVNNNENNNNYESNTYTNNDNHSYTNNDNHSYNNDNNSYSNNANNNNDNSDRNSVSNWVEKLSLTDISVGEILDIYKNDTDLLKHILAAKTEEDKVKYIYNKLICK